MKKNLFYTLALSALMLASCSSESNTETQAVAAAPVPNEVPVGQENHMAVATAQPQAQTSPADLMTEEGLPKDLVCMVNNAYMGKKQFPVPFEEKMYYGCCEMCVNTIKNTREVRYAKAPVRGQEVAKSNAVIARQPGGATGGVF